MVAACLVVRRQGALVTTANAGDVFWGLRCVGAGSGDGGLVVLLLLLWWCCRGSLWWGSRLVVVLRVAVVVVVVSVWDS